MIMCNRCGKEGNPISELKNIVRRIPENHFVCWTHNLILCIQCVVKVQHLMYEFCHNEIDVIGVDQKIVLSEKLLVVEI